MDPLSDALSLAGVRGTLGARIDAGETWNWWAPATDHAAFHAVTAGTAWIAVGEATPIQLLPGDVVLMPTGAAHAMASDEALVRRTRAGAHDDYEIVRDGVVAIGTGPVRAHVLCAHYSHDPAVATKVLSLLPEVVHVRATPGDGLDDTVRLLGRELAERELASDLVLDRLVDVLLVKLLRAWVAAQPDGELPSWLGALRDPVVRAAITELHARPEHPWTAEALAGATAVSRATLTRRFEAAVGESPGSYLTRWRMDLAARRLRDTDDSLTAVARSVGYTSVHAFSRAFSRSRAVPPGQFRLAARAAA